MFGSKPPFPAIARGLLALSLFSGGALADDTATRTSHWSGLPIWGAEAEARGYQVPLPFGIGVSAYSARQPVNIEDLRLGRNGKDPDSSRFPPMPVWASSSRVHFSSSSGRAAMF